MCTRRQFIGGFFGFAVASRFDGLFAQDVSGGRAKRCLLLWMDGGPSQIDTFDPKPGERTGGEFKAIDTAVRGLRISENFPELAKRMKRLSVIRSLTSKEGDHFRGKYHLHTGWPLTDGFARPAAGSLISSETAKRKFPKYVSIGSAGFGPAWFGPDHAPFAIEDPAEALRTLRAIGKKRDDVRLLRELDRDFEASHPSALVERRKAVVRQVEELVDTPFVKALDVPRDARYGDTAFGRSCLLARRLLEAGVSFVEVTQSGWDTHSDNFPALRRLSAAIDGPWSALMDDLSSSGLLDETIVLWLGEFGRTPDVNVTRGRDHYPQVSCAVLGGGGLPGGRIIGETDRLGVSITRDPVRVPDLFATLYSAFGVSPAKIYKTEFGGTAAATDDGAAIKGLQ